MKLLLFDFIRRWWWMLALLFVISLLTTVNGYPFSFGPAAIVCLLFDANRGVFRVVRVLPVPRRVQAQTWWVAGVWLVPILSLVPVLLGTAIYLTLDTGSQIPVPIPHETGLAEPAFYFVSTFSPWFAAGVQLWIGFGFAALCFLLACALPNRQPEGVWETISASVVGALWGLSIPGITFVLPLMPRTPAATHGWHWAVFASVPFLVTLSYLAAPDLIRRRTTVVAAKRPRREVGERPESRGGLTGIPLWLGTFGLRSALMIGAIACTQYFFLRLFTGRSTAPNGIHSSHYLAPMQIAMFAIMLSAISVEWSNLRTLRTLPLSRTGLAGLLLAIPVGNGFVAAVLVTLFSGGGASGVPAVVNIAAQMLYCAGLGALAVAGVLHVASGFRLLIVMAAVIPASGFALGLHLPLVLALSGALALLIAWLLIARGLRKSSAFYQPRSFFGVNIGQPSAVR